MLDALYGAHRAPQKHFPSPRNQKPPFDWGFMVTSPTTNNEVHMEIFRATDIRINAIPIVADDVHHASHQLLFAFDDGLRHWPGFSYAISRLKGLAAALLDVTSALLRQSTKPIKSTIPSPDPKKSKRGMRSFIPKSNPFGIHADCVDINLAGGNLLPPPGERRINQHNRSG
jgi:hypothetical protein